MYKTSTFIISLFCKFQLYDKDIRKHIIEIYTPIIDIILKDIPPARRVLIFKELLPVIKNTIKYLELSKEGIKPPQSSIIPLFKSLLSFSHFLINSIGLKDEEPSTIFNNIMKQVNIDDLVCDIGSCVTSLKNNPDDHTEELQSRVTVLLEDYNTIAGTSFTLNELLTKKATGDNEL